MKTFRSIEEELQTYTEEELRLWNRGYLAATEGFIAQLNADQIRILNKLLELQDKEKRETVKKLLKSRLVVLDYYETHYRSRIAQLERDLE